MLSIIEILVTVTGVASMIKIIFDYDDLIIITVKNSQIIFEVATTGCEVCSGAFGVFEMRKSHF